MQDGEPDEQRVKNIVDGDVSGIVVQAGSEFRRRFVDVLSICVQISVAEDFLLIRLGTPPKVPSAPLGYREAMARWASLETLPELPLYDNSDAMVFDGDLGGRLTRDFERLLRELTEYQVSLRDAMARTQGRSPAPGDDRTAP